MIRRRVEHRPVGEDVPHHRVQRDQVQAPGPRSAKTCGSVSRLGPVSKGNPSRAYRPSLPPTVPARSCTTTRAPPMASRTAAASPPTPAPITHDAAHSLRPPPGQAPLPAQQERPHDQPGEQDHRQRMGQRVGPGPSAGRPRGRPPGPGHPMRYADQTPESRHRPPRLPRQRGEDRRRRRTAARSRTTTAAAPTGEPNDAHSDLRVAVAQLPPRLVHPAGGQP